MTSLYKNDGNIPLCVPEICGNEWNYLKECLDSNWVSSVGPFVPRFENQVAEYVGTQFAVATINGTAALHLALLVVGIEPEDEVLVSTLGFVAPVNAIRYIHAWPVFIDAEPLYWQMDPQRVDDFFTKKCRWRNGKLYNQKTNRRVKAILPVHFLGHPVDMDPILELAAKYNLIVIEDGAEGLGSQYKGRNVGTLGDIACFSFNGNKIITAGGGGVIATNNRTWAERATFLSNQAKEDSFESTHNEIGYNYRLSNLHAAVGCAQLEQIDDYIRNKQVIAEAYFDRLVGAPGITSMQDAPWSFCTFWMYTVLVDPTRYGMSNRELLRNMRKKGIEARLLWRPIHMSQAYRHCQIEGGEVAEQIFDQALSLPCSVGLPAEQLRTVSDFISSNQMQEKALVS